jgi:TonB-dependent SusC/RagA subfamily outer membrane receptor
MRVIILLFLNLLIMHAAFAQLKCRVGELISSSTVPKSDTATRIVLRCYRVLPDNPSPLLVINNKIIPLSRLSAVDPNDIERVDILKGAKATAIFGPEGVGGAIIVTLKTWQLKVKDAQDGRPVAGANILLKGKKSSQMFTSDSNGVARIPRVSKIDSMSFLISSVGYTTLESSLNAGLSEILLDRNAIIQDTIFIKSIITYRRISCGYTICRVTSCSHVLNKNDSIFPALQYTRNNVNLYPNPVRQGASITLDLNNSSAQNFLLSIYSSTGNLLRRSAYRLVKGDSRIILETNPSWAPGIYFIEIINADIKAAIKTKFILQ